MPVPGRAETNIQKDHCLRMLLEYWQEFSTLRLGQLLFNALSPKDKDDLWSKLANIEDQPLMNSLVDFAEWYRTANEHKMDFVSWSKAQENK
jgi:hypothetical protein